MKKKIFIAFFSLAGCSIATHATTKTVKKPELTIRKDSNVAPKADTVLNQQNVFFPNPFMVFPVEK